LVAYLVLFSIGRNMIIVIFGSSFLAWFPHHSS
jgi:hypothetical protein